MQQQKPTKKLPSQQEGSIKTT